MQKTDFVTIAGAIRDCKDALIASAPADQRPLILQTTRSMAIDIGKVCQRQNAKFDFARFMESCGMGPV